MQIKSIKLVNFQAHSKQRVELAPGITTIKGATDKGKSAILRALSWCCLNSMAGDEFIKEGEKKAQVTVTTGGEGEDFGEKICRSRSAGGAVNTYEMGRDLYKAFGQGVPDPIAQHLQLNSLNFQGQHDAPFWFTETAGEVSRRLNAVIDLSVIDSSLSNVSQVVRKTQDRKALCEERLKTVSEELKTMEPQQVRIEEFAALQELEEKSNELNQHSDQLEKLVESIRSNRARIKFYEEQHTDAKAAVELAKEARDASTEADQLQCLLSRMEQLKDQSTPPPLFEPVEALFLEHNQFQVEVSALTNHIVSLETAEHRCKETRLKAEETERRFHKRIKGTSCPLCGTQLK